MSGERPDPYGPPDPQGQPAPPPPAPPSDSWQTAPTTPYDQPAPPATPSPYQATPYDQPSPPPGYPYGPVYPVHPPTDGVSIAALVTGIVLLWTGLLSVVGVLLGLVPLGLGIGGIARTSGRRRSGRPMAITGLVLGGVTILFGIVMTVVYANVDLSDPASDRDPATAWVDPGHGVGVVGQCFLLDLLTAVDFTDVVPVDCAEPHDAEVYHVEVLTDDTFPGEEAVIAQAEEICGTQFEVFVGRDYETSTLDFGFGYPLAGSWKYGNRDVFCYVITVDGSQRTGSARGTGL